MTTNTINKQLQTALMLSAMGLGLLGCQEQPTETYAANEQTEQANTCWAQTTIKHGTRLSYTTNKTMLSGISTDGAKGESSPTFSYNEKQEVAIFIDRDGRNYEEFSRVVDHTGKRNEYDPTRVAERVVRNGQVTAFNNGGKALFTLHSDDHGAKGSEANYNAMLLPCNERSQLMLKQIGTLTTQGSQSIDGSKSMGTATVEQVSENVLKLTQLFRDKQGQQPEQTFSSITYVNTKYGVPVLSEVYDEAGQLQSRTTQLYKMVDNVPVLAYEESIYYTPDLNGQPLENKTITHYENIQILKF